MRTDKIDEKAVEKAYLIYSEGGFDYIHDPTDYFQGTVMEPNHVSEVDGRYTESPTFRMYSNEMKSINFEVEELKRKMVLCRRHGAQGQLQECRNRMAALMKMKEKIDAAMAVEDLGAAQMAVYNSTMDQDDRFSEMDEMAQRIAELEARILEMAGQED